jgi:toxin ParE1/3/4
VRIGASAEQDLLSIMNYISVTLREPLSAKRVYSTIKEKIMNLRNMPERHGVVSEEPFSQMGIRRLFIENYTVFYGIDEEAKTVQIIRILYKRREWQSLL